jgi:hypothetical protein
MPRRERQGSNKPERIVSLANGTDGKAHPRTQLGLRLVKENEPAVEWGEYPRIEPGVYPGYCKRAQWYWEPGFKRWTCILLFDVLSECLQRPLGTIPMWMNGGNGDKPKAGRRTRYLPEWVRANGGPPARRDRLSPRVFAKRMASVRVADTVKGALPYSVVRQILEWSTGTPVNQSHSQGGPK